ncbi:MAG TPA: BON domain-containing protein [Bryobacteraceae bacterium]|nr:BON domain-containing protein [Bryobacteraceae bacterium]
MMRKIQSVSLAVALAVFSVPMFARSDRPRDLSDAVRHELVMQPYYSVFDDLGYNVNPDTGVVALFGAVRLPILKSDAEHSVKKIPGVTQVVNNIKVLPLSPMDNRIRVAEYRAIFGFGGLYRYAMGANPSIHIIVDNGHVTLTGVVDREADRNMASIRANGVPGVFSVTNNLRVKES